MDADLKAGLLDLIDHAAGGGWPVRRACALLGLDDMRAARWQQRRAAGQLADRPPGGHPLHGLLAWERDAIIGASGDWHESTGQTASSPTAPRGSGWCTCRSPPCAGCWPGKA